jgi:hypothetical protein
MGYEEIKKKAEKELVEEIEKEAMKEYKKKLRELHAAKQVVKNIERELRNLDDELHTKFSDIESNS